MTKRLIGFLLIFSLLLAGIPLSATTAQTTARIIGTIRHEGAPVADVMVFAVWDDGFREMQTGPDGIYQIDDAPIGAWVMIFVRPAPDSRLVYRNWRTERLAGDLIKDFDLERGYLFSGTVRLPDGSIPPNAFWMGANPTTFALPEDEWLGETVFPEGGNFEVVLPPGIYWLDTPLELGYRFPTDQIDLTGGDLVDVQLTLQEGAASTASTLGIPTKPPRADLITIMPDADGYATITGQASAVDPSSAVLLLNANAHIATAVYADETGAFSAQLYAPPGSYIIVKYGTGEFAAPLRGMIAGDIPPEVPGGDEINELPGAMLYVNGDTLAGYEFNSVGAFFYDGERIGWSGVRFSGSLQGGEPSEHGRIVQPGQQVTLNGVLRVTSPTINCTGSPPDFGVGVHVDLHHAFNADGSPNPWGVWFVSTLFTPTGLPIEHEAGGETIGVIGGEFGVQSCGSEHSLDVPVNLTFTVPSDLTAGVYQPTLFVLPHNESIRSDDEQLMVIWYDVDPLIKLPPLVVGEVASPHIPWVLLGDYPVNGSRGIMAREDANQFAMLTRVVTPPSQATIPRLDGRSGQPITYQLEPGSNWLSSTDRRQANAPYIPLKLPAGDLTIQVQKPDGSVDTLGPAPIRQSSVRTPSTPGGSPLDQGTGQVGEIFHLATMDETFAYQFDQYGPHVITVTGSVEDVFGNFYPIDNTYDVIVAQTLDLDPAQLPTTPYMQGDFFAPGLHVFPPLPADVTITVTHMPNSDPAQAVTKTFTGRANRFGYFQPAIGDEFQFSTSGEFRVDYRASYEHPDGTQWAGAMTWGSVVEGTTARIEAHGRRGMDYPDNRIDDMPAWFEVFNLPENKIGIENYYPYFSGDIHWGNEDRGPGDSIHSVITIKDLTPDQMIYNLLRQHKSRARNEMRWPPDPFEDPNALEKRIAIGEAPLFITTSTGHDPAVYPDEIDLWGYWYGSSQRPDVRVREIISEDGMGTAYWRFDDTYGYQIGEGAAGDLPGDIKWEFGGAVFRVPSQGINEYAIYSSLWVLLPHNDPVGARVTPPFQDATGASINGGPIMMLAGEEIDMLFLPKSIRPGDLLEVGDVVAFSGHVGPPLDSQVSVTITAPSGTTYQRAWHANKIGWLYDPTFNFVANEMGRWTVDVQVLHDQPYVGNGVIPQSHNTGTVLGTHGQYEFYVMPPDAPRVTIIAPTSGFLPWERGDIAPITFEGIAPAGTTAIYYTVHDKGVVMDQGVITPNADGGFQLVYDARALNQIFPFVSLTAHEGPWEGLADEVTINFLAVGPDAAIGNTITLIGEEIFIGQDEVW